MLDRATLRTAAADAADFHEKCVELRGIEPLTS
jgi:hypothetical protein